MKIHKTEWRRKKKRAMCTERPLSRGGRSVTVVDEAVTVVDDPTVQHEVRGLSAGQGNTAGCSAPGSASVMVMR